MLKKHMLACLAASALFTVPAIAQTNPAPATTTNQPATTAQTGAAGASNFIATRPADQFRASDLTGERVYGANNENIGEVNDVLLDRTGKVTAVIIGVGGFLGIGEKDVALPMTALQFAPDTDNATAARTTTTTTGAVNAPAAPATTTGSTANTGQTTVGTAGTARDNDGIPGRIMLSMTKEQLQQAPTFRDDPNDANRSTTTAPAKP
jgi:sporulation protein YlmC with PRC-barrel domain